jgi:hypothetical protein
MYNMHLKCATIWHNYWHILQSTIDNKLQQDMEAYYDNLNKKLDNLQSKQTTDSNKEYCVTLHLVGYT